MLNEPVLIDTGPLIAFYNQKDPQHTNCRELMDSVPFGKAYTCWPVVTEAAYMLRKRPSHRDDLLRSLTVGDLIIQRLRERDLQPVHDIFTKYHDQEIDLADACLLHLADREDINAVFTLDRRHFGMFRRLNGKPLRLLPETDYYRT